ncbi:MAG: hypothetical protein O4808_05795, partial [Trichodesmium sp. St17_bin3_1_1]|nr:hypothetical protein [Trichodesmium sp. St17_bin3_1_1]
NIDKFDDFFAQLLQQWIIDTCSKANPEEKEAILEIVEGLCIDIFQFPIDFSDYIIVKKIINLTALIYSKLNFT